MNTFKGDEHALKGKVKIIVEHVVKYWYFNKCHLVIRDKINEEYKKYKHVTNSAAIEEVNIFYIFKLHSILYNIFIYTLSSIHIFFEHI